MTKWHLCTWEIGFCLAGVETGKINESSKCVSTGGCLESFLPSDGKPDIVGLEP